MCLKKLSSAAELNLSKKKTPSEDGACVYLDKNNLCSIYDKRPIQCRVRESGESLKKNNPGFTFDLIKGFHHYPHQIFYNGHEKLHH